MFAYGKASGEHVRGITLGGCRRSDAQGITLRSRHWIAVSGTVFSSGRLEVTFGVEGREGDSPGIILSFGREGDSPGITLSFGREGDSPGITLSFGREGDSPGITLNSGRVGDSPGITLGFGRVGDSRRITPSLRR